jgi:hypothetical protein
MKTRIIGRRTGPVGLGETRPTFKVVVETTLGKERVSLDVPYRLAKQDRAALRRVARVLRKCQRRTGGGEEKFVRYVVAERASQGVRWSAALVERGFEWDPTCWDPRISSFFLFRKREKEEEEKRERRQRSEEGLDPLELLCFSPEEGLG